DNAAGESHPFFPPTGISLRLGLGLDDLERRAVLPGPPGKIGALHRPAPPRDRALGQLRHSAPRRTVVHVHVRRLPRAQALDEAVVLDVVHSSVSRAAGALLERLPQRVLVLATVRLEIFPLIGGAAAFEIDLLIGVVSHGAGPALQAEGPTVRRG